MSTKFKVVVAALALLSTGCTQKVSGTPTSKPVLPTMSTLTSEIVTK